MGLTPQTICRWVKAYRRQGNVALKATKKGRPPGGKLLPWQAAQLAQAVTDHHPEQLKLPFPLWTREAVALLIKRRFGVHLSVWAVGRYLPRRGFTPQKPARRAYLIIDRHPVHRSLEVKNWVKENLMGEGRVGDGRIFRDSHA